MSSLSCISVLPLVEHRPLQRRTGDNISYLHGEVESPEIASGTAVCRSQGHGGPITVDQIAAVSDAS